MYTQCEHCGEFAVDDSENIEVCKSCGIVVEERTFSGVEHAPNCKPYTRFTKSEARLYNQKRKPIALLHGQRILDNLYHDNKIPSRYRTEINELFKLIVSVRRFSKRSDAGIAAACCLFLLMRKNKEAIAISTLCKQIHCTKGKFSFYLKFLKSCLSSNEKFKCYSYVLESDDSDVQKNEDHIPDIVPSMINEICENAEVDEKPQLMKKTSSLVQLAHSCWLFTGRCPRSVVAASAFLCWKSMDPVRRKTSFTKFCSDFEINIPAAKFRVRELKALLLKLGKMIPSRVENYVNEKNLLFHLNTILEHSETLRNDLFPDSYTCEEVDNIEFSNFRTPPLYNYPRKEPSDPVHYDSDVSASDIEISDSEIESYLVSGKKKVIEFCEKKNLTAI